MAEPYENLTASSSQEEDDLQERRDHWEGVQADEAASHDLPNFLDLSGIRRCVGEFFKIFVK
jgi:hypothetical protein